MKKLILLMALLFTFNVSAFTTNDTASADVVVGRVEFKEFSIDDSNYTFNSNEDLIIRLDTTNRNFKVYIDGNLVNEQNYIIDQHDGYINLIIKKGFLNTLEPKEHTIKIVFDNQSYEGKVIINKDKVNPNNNQNNNNNNKKDNVIDKVKKKIDELPPKTVDTIKYSVITLAVSLIALLIGIKIKRNIFK